MIPKPFHLLFPLDFLRTNWILKDFLLFALEDGGGEGGWISQIKGSQHILSLEKENPTDTHSETWFVHFHHQQVCPQGQISYDHKSRLTKASKYHSKSSKSSISICSWSFWGHQPTEGERLCGGERAWWPGSQLWVPARPTNKLKQVTSPLQV